MIEEPAEIDHFLVDGGRGVTGGRRDTTACQRLPLAAPEPGLIHRHVHEVVDDSDARHAAANLDPLHVPLQPCHLTVETVEEEITQARAPGGRFWQRGELGHAFSVSWWPSRCSTHRRDSEVWGTS